MEKLDAQKKMTSIKKQPPRQKLDADTKRLIRSIESAGIHEFVDYIQSPWKMFLVNLVAGIARGLGTLIGAGIVIALLGWFLSTLIDLPLIGKKIEPYVQNVQTEFKKYTEATDYRQNFERMEKSLESIDKSLKTR